MNGPSSSAPFLLPLSQASASQLAQAIAGITVALAPYYPTVTSTHWHQLLTLLELPLFVADKRTAVSAAGLSTLIQYFEADKVPAGRPPDQVPASPPATLPGRQKEQREIKKTYGIWPEVLKRLTRASYWRREGKSALVNRALTDLLSQYPESLRPLPDEK